MGSGRTLPQYIGWRTMRKAPTISLGPLHTGTHTLIHMPACKYTCTPSTYTFANRNVHSNTKDQFQGYNRGSDICGKGTPGEKFTDISIIFVKFPSSSCPPLLPPSLLSRRAAGPALDLGCYEKAGNLECYLLLLLTSFYLAY